MPRDLALPPTDIPPERLFVLLIQPSPSLSIRHRIAGAEDVPLVVRPIPSLEMAFVQAIADDAPAEVRRQRYLRELVARVLWTREGPAFASPEDVGDLDISELGELAGEVGPALATIGPTYARSDWQAWQATLERGARHPLNMSAAIALASCADYGQGAIVYRPERFWGRPTMELLDGHWMAYRAARAAWIKDAPSSGPRTVAEALRQAETQRANAEAVAHGIVPPTPSGG